jgi:hypothetical protein
VARVATGAAGLTGVAKQVKKAGKQLKNTIRQIGELTDEVVSDRRGIAEPARAGDGFLADRRPLFVAPGLADAHPFGVAT